MTWGQEVVKDPITGEDRIKWTQNQTLDPELQAALDAQIGLQRERSEQAGDLYARAGAALEDPFNPYLTNWGSTSDPDVNQGYMSNEELNALRQKSEDAMYQRQTSRLDPQFEQERSRKEAQLTAMGLRPTDQAWQTQMDQFNRGRNDAYEQARLGSIGEGRNEYQTMFGTGLQAQDFTNRAMQQNWLNAYQNANYQNQLRQAQMAEQLQMRNQPLNEINALLHGQQVQSPQFQGFSNAGAAQAPDLMGAMQNTYNADLNRTNASNMAMQGLFGGLSSFFMPF